MNGGKIDGGALRVDGGRGALDAPPPIVVQMPFPAEWRMVLIFDHACRGLHGAAEKEAFRVLPPYKAGLADRLSRLVLMRALPALAERDIEKILSDAVAAACRRARELADVFGEA